MAFYKNSRKEFLDNESKFAPNEFASICWSVVLEDNNKYDTKAKEENRNSVCLSAEIRVADCSRSVSIDLFSESLEDIDARIEKVNRMRASLDALKDALWVARGHAEKRLAEPRESDS